MNFISNSIKFTHTGKIDIIIHEHETSPFIKLEVADTGEGIKENIQPKLFNMYFTAGTDSYDNV
jgi:signal transduction histidine kinase